MISDTEILDWLQEHYTKFCQDVSDEPEYTLTVINKKADDVKYKGGSLRECVLKAMAAE